MPGTTIIEHDGTILNIDMRRNALRLLTPYDNLRYALRGLQLVWTCRKHDSNCMCRANGTPLNKSLEVSCSLQVNMLQVAFYLWRSL